MVFGRENDVLNKRIITMCGRVEPAPSEETNNGCRLQQSIQNGHGGGDSDGGVMLLLPKEKNTEYPFWREGKRERETTPNNEERPMDDAEIN